jgi:hypothetical protein
MKQRALFILRCVSDSDFYLAHAWELSPATRELVDFMRAHGTCSSWAWHAESLEAHATALALVRSSAHEQPRELRRAA